MTASGTQGAHQDCPGLNSPILPSVLAIALSTQPLSFCCKGTRKVIILSMKWCSVECFSCEHSYRRQTGEVGISVRMKEQGGEEVV